MLKQLIIEQNNICKIRIFVIVSILIYRLLFLLLLLNRVLILLY